MKLWIDPLPFAVVLVSLVCALPGAGADRPNILFIYTDDQSHVTVSCYPEAYDWVRTPNIDALAADGIRFRFAYIGSWCMPSRATLLTGHHSYGVESMRMAGSYPGSEYNPEKCPFWPKVFRENGYQTAQIGKWHTGTDTGFGRDWDYQAVWNRPRHTGNAGSYYQEQLIEFNGGEAELVPGYSTDNYTEWALEYIRGTKGRDREKPWYLWLCYGAVHGPFTPAERHREAYPDVEVPVPADIYPPRDGKPAYVKNRETWVQGENGQPQLKGKRKGKSGPRTPRGIHGPDLEHWVQQYHQGVLAIDEGVGKIIAALKETGQYENTLVVFTSDQGFAWGQHGFQTKLAPYDATIRSPLIVSLPGRLPRGKVCPSPAGGVDLVPTFFSFAGIAPPWKMHGQDLTELLEHPETAARERPLLTALTGASYGPDCDVVPDPVREKEKLYRGSEVPWWVSLHDGRYKYIRTLIEGEIEELYDLESDPEELHNLALDGSNRRRVIEMREATVAELKRTDAAMADRLPAVAAP